MQESLTESQRAESEAASKRLAAEAAQQDASKNQGEVDSLVAEASAAARLWQEKQAVAAAKQDAVLRMRARDAAVAAGAAKPPVPAAQDVEKEKEGAEALFSIAADATMARERELLANIKRAAKQLSAAEMMARGRIGVVDAAAPTGAADGASSAASSEGAGAAYLRSKLDSMLAGIEGEMERLRGDMDLKKALLKVDSNRDGQVTASEIEAALKTIVRSAQTDAAAAALIRLLDSDRDGSVNVDSLNRFLSEFAERNARKEAKEAKDKEKAEKEAVSTPKGTPTAAAVSKEAASSFSEEESDHDDHDHHGSSSKGRKQPPKELK